MGMGDRRRLFDDRVKIQRGEKGRTGSSYAYEDLKRLRPISWNKTKLPAL